MIFRQLFDNVSCTYTYLIGDPTSRQAVIIDPVFEMHRRDLALIRELDLGLSYCIDTHCHADHVTGAWLIRRATGCKYATAASNDVQGVSVPLEDGQVVQAGSIALRALATPGHTAGCMSFVIDEARMVFTGDALLIRGAGRTDFQGGSAHDLYRSLREKLFSLDDDFLVYPGHDYRGCCTSSIGEERIHNPRIGGQASEHDFVGFMDNLNLPHPKKMDEALPANLRGGKPEDGLYPDYCAWGPVNFCFSGICEIDAEWVATHPTDVTIVDVRDDWELKETGFIKDALHIPLDNLLQRLDEIKRDKPVIMICRSGKRSGQGVRMLSQKGFDRIANLTGGMVAWLDRDFPVTPE